MNLGITDVDTLLLWATTSGGASAAVSFLISLSSRFTALDSRIQFAIRIGSLLAISLSSRFLIDFIPLDTKAMLSPYVLVLVTVLGGSFVVHKAGTQGETVATSRALRRDKESFK